MDLRRRDRVIGSIADGKPLTASFAMSNFGVEWIVREYAFVPAGTLVWLRDDKVLSAHTFAGHPETFFQKTDLAALAPSETESIGIASMDYLMMQRRKKTKAD